jgi:hypothetical protein
LHHGQNIQFAREIKSLNCLPPPFGKLIGLRSDVPKPANSRNKKFNPSLGVLSVICRFGGLNLHCFLQGVPGQNQAGNVFPLDFLQVA